MALQAVHSGVVTAWLQPQFLDFDVEVEVGLPTTPPPPAVSGPSPTPPPGDAIPQMALADLLKHEDVVGNPVAAISPSSPLNEVVDIALDDAAPPVDPLTPELPSPGVANDVVAQTSPPDTPADNFSPPALLIDCDPRPPRPRCCWPGTRHRQKMLPHCPSASTGYDRSGCC